LKFSLGGNCKVVMITNVSPSSLHYEETHNTLKYANRAKNIKTKIEQNLIHVESHIAQYPKIIQVIFFILFIYLFILYYDIKLN